MGVQSCVACGERLAGAARFCSTCGAVQSPGIPKRPASGLSSAVVTAALALAMVVGGIGAAYSFVPTFRDAAESLLAAHPSTMPDRVSAPSPPAPTPMASAPIRTPLPSAPALPTPSAPAPPTPTQAPPQLPNVGQLPTDAIVQATVALNVRTAPDGSLLMTLEPGDRMRIDGTPSLIGRTLWYPVVRRQQPGWAAAGSESTAYLTLAAEIPGLHGLWDYTGEPSATTDDFEDLLTAVNAADLEWMNVSAGVLYGSTRSRIEWFDAHLPAPCYEAAWRAWRQADIELQKSAQVVFDYLDAYPNGDPRLGRNVNHWADRSIEHLNAARDLALAGYCGY